MINIASMDDTLKDLYPLPGERIKQYVVDGRTNDAWEHATCPTVEVSHHEDNTGASCCSGPVRWRDLAMAHCCSTCSDIAERDASRPDIVAWRAERDARPKPCADRTKLSDEIEPERPMLAFITKRTFPER